MRPNHSSVYSLISQLAQVVLAGFGSEDIPMSEAYRPSTLAYSRTSGMLKHLVSSRQISLASSSDLSDECDHRNGSGIGENTMNTFTIDDDNNITTYASTEEANHGGAAGLIHFDSPAALAKVSANWPMSRFVEIWNSIPGHSPVKKFQDRQKALASVWRAIQSGVGQARIRSKA